MGPCVGWGAPSNSRQLSCLPWLVLPAGLPGISVGIGASRGRGAGGDVSTPASVTCAQGHWSAGDAGGESSHFPELLVKSWLI